MGSVEGDELRYDGGNRGATQELIDLEDAERRLTTRLWVEQQLQDPASATSQRLAERLIDAQLIERANALRAVGKRSEAHALLDNETDDQVERLIDDAVENGWAE